MCLIVTVHIAAETRAFCFIGRRAKHYNNCFIKWRLEAKQTKSEIGKLGMGKIEDGDGIFNCMPSLLTANTNSVQI